MNELLKRYESLLRRAEKLLMQPPITANKEKWLAEYRQLANEQRRTTEQLDLWNGPAQPHIRVYNETDSVLEVRSEENGEGHLRLTIKEKPYAD